MLKIYQITLFLLLLFNTTIFSQDLPGRKIISGNINFNLLSVGESGTNYTTNLNNLYGKIRQNNTYLSVGGNFGITNLNSTGRQSDANWMLGPDMEYGKFITIADKFYFAPAFGGNINGHFGGDVYGLSLNANIHPLRFMYHFGQNFMLTGETGQGNLSFSKIQDVTQISLNGSLSNKSGIGLFYTFK